MTYISILQLPPLADEFRVVLDPRGLGVESGDGGEEFGLPGFEALDHGFCGRHGARVDFEGGGVGVGWLRIGWRVGTQELWMVWTESCVDVVGHLVEVAVTMCREVWGTVRAVDYGLLVGAA